MADDTSATSSSATTIPVRKPFLFGGTTYSSIALRQPNGGDLLRFLRKSGSFQERIIQFTVDLTEQPEEFLAAMDARDLATLIEAVGVFTTPYQPDSTD